MLTEKQNFIRDFDEHNEYSSFSGSTDYIRPNVSSCEKENHVHYDPCKDVTGVTFEEDSITLEKGKTYKLKVVVLPEESCNKKLTWESSNEDVATVDENGVVSAITDSGRATITVTTDEGGYTAQCEVRVIHLKNTVTYYASSKLKCCAPLDNCGSSVRLRAYCFRNTNGDKTLSATCSNHSFSNGVGTISPNFTINFIVDGAFHNCSNVTKIIFPAGVEKVTYGIIYECTGPLDIVFEGTTPPVWVRPYEGNPFLYSTNYTIYVPAESVDAYKAAFYFAKDKIQPISEE